MIPAVICINISESCALSCTNRKYTKKEAKRKINYLPVSNDWSMSRKGFVLFSAITLICTVRVWCPLSAHFLPVDLFLWWCFLSFLPPLFPVPSVSLSPDFSPRERCSAHRDWLVALSGTHCVYGAGKASLSHFLLFSLKLAAGVAYLPWTEILVVRRWGVAVIMSFTIISCRLINLKLCHFIF